MKKYTKITIISRYIQILKKQKYVFKYIQYINKKEIKLLEFLWLNKYIYGFSLNENNFQKKQIIMIYLKPIKFSSLSYIKINKFKNIKQIRKTQNWAKNSCFIIITLKGIITLKHALKNTIGGFLFYKLH